MSQLPPEVIPDFLFGLLVHYGPAIVVAIIIVVSFYLIYNRQGEKPKKKSKYPDFEMDLPGRDSQ